MLAIDGKSPQWRGATQVSTMRVLGVRRPALRVAGLLVACLAVGAAAHAQATSTPPASANELLAAGWSALARGNQAEAKAIAARIERLNDGSRSAAVVSFLVEVGIATEGYVGGLTAYEKWLGKRTLEDAYVLRPVAAAVLRDLASGTNAGAKVAARQALAADGDPQAAAELKTAIESGDLTAVAAAAATGNTAAVDRLLGKFGDGSKVTPALLEAAGATGDRRFVAAAMPLLQSEHDFVQAAAARALGRLGGRDAIPALRDLLKDPRYHVQFAAAAALFRLGDPEGSALIEEAARSEHAAVRVGAAEATASRPDQGWLQRVRDLANDTGNDPQVRVNAARLLAPHDAAAAAALLRSLMQDQNPAIRQLAELTIADDLAPGSTDVKTLRELLRAGEPRLRAQAAARLLALTR